MWYLGVNLIIRDLLSTDGSEQFLLKSGWKKEKDSFVYCSNELHLTMTTMLLQFTQTIKEILEKEKKQQRVSTLLIEAAKYVKKRCQFLRLMLNLELFLTF